MSRATRWPLSVLAGVPGEWSTNTEPESAAARSPKWLPLLPPNGRLLKTSSLAAPAVAPAPGVSVPLA